MVQDQSSEIEIVREDERHESRLLVYRLVTSNQTRLPACCFKEIRMGEQSKTWSRLNFNLNTFRLMKRDLFGQRAIIISRFNSKYLWCSSRCKMIFDASPSMLWSQFDSHFVGSKRSFCIARVTRLLCKCSSGSWTLDWSFYDILST